MLFKFWVRSDTAEDFILQIDADATNTFFQLHEVLQEECQFDSSQMVGFFVADEEWDNCGEIKIFGSSPLQKFSSGESAMKMIKLGDILKAEEDKLLYTYDLLSNKSLFIELYQIRMQQSINMPTLIFRKGNVPVQENKLNPERYPEAADDTDSQHIFEDLGELDDLFQIYGGMSNTIL